MKPHRCRDAAIRLLAGAALALGLQCLAPPRAGAVQLFIESAFVHKSNSNCIVEVINGVPRFRCPPINIDPNTGFDTCGGVRFVGPPPSCADRCSSAPAPAFACPSVGPCDPSLAGCPSPQGGVNPGAQYGNISNDPHIEFDQNSYAGACQSRLSAFQPGQTPLPPFDTANNICNSSVFLCASVGYGNNDTTATTQVPIDSISFEVFKFQNGSNPLDDSSSGTPPIRTFFIDSPGVIPQNNTSSSAGPIGPFCALFDGFVNILGEQGKTNGTYGFRAKTLTNQSGASGNIQITAVRAYPSGATFNADFSVADKCTAIGCVATQTPLVIDVTNVHNVISSPTLVGSITPVPVQPYNLFYRLSKDATMYITISQPPDPNGSPTPTVVRTVLPGIARVGEGTPSGSLSNGDSWNGRADNGDLLPSGIYLATLQAFARDQYGDDLSLPTTVQIGLDPLQITDIRVTPITEGSTSLAVLDYILTEPATVFIDIYPPGTQFCPVNLVGFPNPVPPLNNVSLVGLDAGAATPDWAGQPKNFNPNIGACAAGATPTATPVKRIVEQKNSRTRVISFWDGRDTNGQLVPDGDYVFVIYAALASQNGFTYSFDSAGNPTPNGDRRIWTSIAKSGFVTVDRGFVGITQVNIQSAIFGSSPAIAGLNPFRFTYQLSRDAIVNMTIFDATGLKPIRHLIVNETRPGQGFPDTELWSEPVDDNGFWISSGTYMVQLTATDPVFPMKVSTTTAMFPVDPYRMADIQTTPILGGASDFVLVSYTPSISVLAALNIYPPGTIIRNSSGTWPPCLQTIGPPCGQVLTPAGQPAVPVITFQGLRVGRLRITEQWDGRDVNGLTVPDGQYIFTLTAQSTTTPQHFVSDRVFGSVVVNRGLIQINPFNVKPDIPTLFASSETIELPNYQIDYAVTRQSSVTIQILNSANPPQVVRTIIAGQVRSNGVLLSEVWDGKDAFGNFPPAGFYLVRALAIDAASTALAQPATAQTTISFDPIRIYDVAVSPARAGQGAQLFYQVSETMKVAVKVYKPGTSFDPQGNPSPPESISLVKRIVAVHPPRTQIESDWDGTDLRLTLVPDGVYRFKIVGSTDSKAIDDVTGNVLQPGSLSQDQIIDDVAVVRNGSLDPEGDFERNTFIYPNPITSPQATISIFNPFQGSVLFRLYNIAGQLVMQQDMGVQPPSYAGGQIEFVWPRTNQAGRGVARGIYYLVVRVEDTLGGKSVLQTVKKVLIP